MVRWRSARCWMRWPLACQPEEPDETATKARARFAGTPLLIVLAMAQFMVVLDFTIVNVALPSIQAGLHIGTSTLQWLVSGYAVSFGGFLLLGGKALRTCSAKPACSGSGWSSSWWPAWPAAWPSSRSCSSPRGSCRGSAPRSWLRPGWSLLVTSWPGERARSHALGVYGAVVSTGFASGAVLGGLLVQESWRLVFFVNAPVGVALRPATGCCPPRRRPARAAWTCPARHRHRRRGADRAGGGAGR